MSPAKDAKRSTFLGSKAESRELNQYWYSQHTIDVLCSAIKEGLSSLEPSTSTRVAFLSTPSLFFAFDSVERENFSLLDYDKTWEGEPGYNYYDYRNPLNIEKYLQHSFDMVVIDPPFISKVVWEKYSRTARALLKEQSSSLVLCTTVYENAPLMHKLFGATPKRFRPSIPNLVYQYSAFTNFHSIVMAEPNNEILE